MFEAHALRILVGKNPELDYGKANFKVVESSLGWAAERWRAAGNTTRARELDLLRANLGAVTPLAVAKNHPTIDELIALTERDESLQTRQKVNVDDLRPAPYHWGVTLTTAQTGVAAEFLTTIG